MDIQYLSAELLGEALFGFHQYDLTAHPHLIQVSDGLCALLGASRDTLLVPDTDAYVLAVHPLDRAAYLAFLDRATKGRGSLQTEYRLLCGEEVRYMRDSFTVSMVDGAIIGTSVLTDITDLKKANEELQFVSENIPYGFLKYTCEKQPRITYINKTMAQILRIPAVSDGELDYLELYKNDIFLAIPMEERRRFSMYLNRVYSAGAPLAGEMTLLRCDGTRAYVFGWVTKTVNEAGQEEFQSVCMDLTERHRERRASETKRYIKALTDVYEKIFEFNIAANTVKCLHSNNSPTFRLFENIALQIEDATEKWITNAVVAEEQDGVRRFFDAFCQKKLFSSGERPPQITYTARASSGELKRYSALFIKFDENIAFLCCRCLGAQEATDALRIENDRLRENMKELVLRFTDGIAAFEVSSEGIVTPLYASENVYEFFGYSQEEWLDLMNKGTPLENFVAYSEANFEDFLELLRNGEAEFTYFDYKTERERRIKAICSQKVATPNSPRYVMLYSVETPTTLTKKTLPENRTVSIRTFGYFDVFVGDRPIAFRNKKSKELFALLVDRRGGFVTSSEAIAYLWEDEPANAVTLSRYRKVALRLKNTLEEYGIGEIMESVDGKRRVVPERVECDLYDHLSGKKQGLFKGSYLSNYSWAETTLGALVNEVN